MVYFISDGLFVKIGITSCTVQQRLRQLQTGHPLPLKVLATMKGSAHEEQQLHVKFAKYHERGEWFVLTPAIKRYITSLKKKKKKPVTQRTPRTLPTRK